MHVRVLPNTQQPSDRPVPTHTRTRSTHTSHTRIHHDNTRTDYSSGPYTHSSVHSCKIEESLKRLLLPCWTKAANQQCVIPIAALQTNGDDCMESSPLLQTDDKMWVFHCLARLSLGGKQPRDYLADFAALNAQSTRHGTRPGPKLAPWCTIHCSRRQHSTKNGIINDCTALCCVPTVVPGTVVTAYCLLILGAMAHRHALQHTQK